MSSLLSGVYLTFKVLAQISQVIVFTGELKTSSFFCLCCYFDVANAKKIRSEHLLNRISLLKQYMEKTRFLWPSIYIVYKKTASKELVPSTVQDPFFTVGQPPKLLRESPVLKKQKYAFLNKRQGACVHNLLTMGPKSHRKVNHISRTCCFELCLYHTLFRYDLSQKVIFLHTPANDFSQLEIEGYSLSLV